MTTDEAKVQVWHELFDQLCQRAGYHDNAALSSAYCSRVGRNGHDNFETTIKNLRNWRAGRHLPLRRNAVILAQLLGVDEDAVLQRRWNELYAEARGQEPQSPCADEADLVGAETLAASTAATAGVKFHSGVVGVMAVLLVAGAASAYFYLRAPRLDERLPLIGYDAYVKMVVGESRLVHGDRGDCGGQPPDWYYTLPRVPISQLGIFSDGGIARKLNNTCGHEVLVRAVRFTATSPGSEELNLLEDYMKVVVVAEGNPRHE